MQFQEVAKALLIAFFQNKKLRKKTVRALPSEAFSVALQKCFRVEDRQTMNGLLTDYLTLQMCDQPKFAPFLVAPPLGGSPWQDTK